MQALEPVDEHGLLVAVSLTDEEVKALLQSPAVAAVAPSVEPGCWDVRAGPFVGVVPLPTGRELRLLPKLRVERVLFLVAYGRDQSGWAADPAAFAGADDLVTGIAVAFATYAERALHRGVLQGYVVREESLPGLRGRLREAEQASRRFGLPLPVEVRYDDFAIDIVENRMLRAAAQRLVRLRDVPSPVARRLRHIDALLDGVTSTLPRPRPSVPITRLNQHYRPALALASLVLDATSYDVGHGPHVGTAFLFNMFQVFEDFLTATLTSALERRGGEVRSQHVDYLDAGERNRIDVRPDLTWWHGGRCLAVIDAKYKSLDAAGIRHPDTYQAVSYALALRTERAHLVYAENPPAVGQHRIRGTAIDLSVEVLDLSLPPARLLAEVDRLAESIAVGATEVVTSDVG